MTANESLQPSSIMPFLYDSNNETNLASSGSLSSSMTLSGVLSPRNPSSQLIKTYRQAANLFLTRRLPEALSTIEPLISLPSADAADDDTVKDATNGETDLAPIALAPRGIRIKVWILWVTLLNAVVELGAEEGKHAFGSARWKTLVAKARDGTAWDEVVEIGYGGVEGNVDADVVVNLATLLLAHSPSQKLNQTRLEAYLSAMAHPQFDVTSHLSSQKPKRTSSGNGTNTPRDLQTTIKLLELYTLHVLPRNGEWDYAREFITVNELLDEDRKEAFLQALTNLEEEQQQAAAREQEIQKAQLEQLERQQKEEEEEQRRQQKREEERKREEAKRQKKPLESKDNRPKPINTRGGSGGTASRPRPKKDLTKHPRATLMGRFGAIFSNLQTLILNTAQSLRSNPLLLLRTILFLLAFTIAFGRRKVRARIKRAFDQAWFKIAETVGMGMKVSSI